MVSIITINYNTTSLTGQLLASIQRLYGESIEVVVVDNGSTVNPGPLLLREFPWITFIRSERNLGFAGGNNLGSKAATGKYLFFINNDTEFMTDIITRMVTLMETHPSIGVLCPLLRYYDSPQVIQYAGFTAMDPFLGRNKCITEVADRTIKGLQFTDYAHGAAMMVPRSVVDRVGAMNENYFLYFEELDWSEQIKRAGYLIAVDTRSEFFHKESQSVAKVGELKSYLMTRNRILFMRKFSNPLQLTFFWMYYLMLALPKDIMKSVFQRQLQNAKASLAGVWWNVRFPVFSTTIGYKFNQLRK